MATVWGIHMEWDHGQTAANAKDIAIGWSEIGDLQELRPSRDSYKVAFAKIYPQEKPGAVPVKAGVLYRFCR